MKKLLSFWFMSVVVFVSFLGLPPQTALACSCVLDISQAESFANAEAVFSGRVLSLASDTSLMGAFRQYRKAEIEVQTVWKGDVTNPATLVTGLGGGDCGYDFIEGKSYLFYTHKGEMYGGGRGKLETGICSSTKLLAAAEEDLLLLGQGKSPLEKPLTMTLSESWVVVGGIFFLLLIGLVMLLVPQRIITLKQSCTIKAEVAEHPPSVMTIKNLRIIGIIIMAFGLFTVATLCADKSLWEGGHFFW